MILMIDNYDSFTYNLVQRIGELDAPLKIRVFRNDKISVDQADSLAPERVIISPGPCTPLEAGISNDAIQRFGPRLPVLGVCLGHQCLGYSFGGRVAGAGEIKHGKSSLIHHDGRGLYEGLPNPFPAIRYHSLAVMRDGLPDCLEVSAWTENGIIMGLRHREYPIEGVQFHPESIMTEIGKDLLKNFIAMRGGEQ